jgi:hypothetical protein
MSSSSLFAVSLATPPAAGTVLNTGWWDLFPVVEKNLHDTAKWPENRGLRDVHESGVF